MAADPLREYLKAQGRTDEELKRVFERAARDARAQIRRSGSQVRKAQLQRVIKQINRAQRALWVEDTLGITQRGRGDAIEAAERAADALVDELYRRLPERQAEALERGLDATAAAGIEAEKARVPRQLSAAVVGNGKLAQKRIDQMIRSGLVRGLSAQELAAEVYGYISPTVPGGASYAALRLARTEINNAYHQQQIEGGRRPGVKAIKWNLSGSHKVPDECNRLDGKTFQPDDVPDKPHPQCLCYLTYEMDDLDDFLAALEAGEFDEQLGVEPPTSQQNRYEERVANARTGGQALDAVPAALGRLTVQQERVAEGYRTSEFLRMNKLLRTGTSRDDMTDDQLETMADVDVLDSAMAPIEHDVVAWRGLFRSRRLFGDALDQDLTGFEWDELAYQSMSVNEGVAAEIAHRDDEQGLLMRILVPRGNPGVVLSAERQEGESINADQGEILGGRGKRWRVVADYGIHPDGHRLLDVEIIGDVS